MKGSVLAARKADVIERLAAETKRLGGEFSPPAARGDVEHQQLALLEALAEALAAISSTDEVMATVVVVDGQTGEASKPAGESPAGGKGRASGDEPGEGQESDPGRASKKRGKGVGL